MIWTGSGWKSDTANMSPRDALKSGESQELPGNLCRVRVHTEEGSAFCSQELPGNLCTVCVATFAEEDLAVGTTCSLCRLFATIPKQRRSNSFSDKLKIHLVILPLYVTHRETFWLMMIPTQYYLMV